MRLRGVAACQSIDMRITARIFQQLVEILRQRSEALLVIGFAAKARHRNEIGSGARGNRGETCTTETHANPQRGTPANFHTTPHFWRSSHSEERNRIIRKKMTGIFHRSFVSRTVMPASEYEISPGSLERS